LQIMAHHRLGLVVGKFSPLHFGHEWLINQAASHCDQLLILSYANPSFARCGSSNRRHWLSTRFPLHRSIVIDDAGLRQKCLDRGIGPRPIPENSASDRDQQEFLGWLLHEVLQVRPDVFFCSEPYGPSCATTLSRTLGHAVSAVVFDRDYSSVPISATEIRRDPYGLRHWMAPVVAGAFVHRVVLLGGESSGKSTLAAALASRLETLWVHEYGRELWERQDGVMSEADLLAIGQRQIEREEEALGAANRYLFCDTSPLTTAGYSLWMFGRIDPRLLRLAGRKYDAALLCKPDFAFVQDGYRRDDSFRRQQHAWYLEQAATFECPVLEVEGTLPQRVSTTLSWLAQPDVSLAELRPS
jgi:HTH-type transcriptional repressor of NAD biosynthesis genes